MRRRRGEGETEGVKKREAVPTWGEPPSGTTLAELLSERWAVSDALTVTVHPEGRLVLVLTPPDHRYEISIRYLRGAGDADPWLLLADALDGLFGMFCETRSHRDLPTGNDIEFQGAVFQVMVEHTMPSLVAAADRWLEEH